MSHEISPQAEDVMKKQPITEEREPSLATGEATPVALGWRTWVVVFISAYLTYVIYRASSTDILLTASSLFMQIFTTVAAPSVIAFIVQDLGQQSTSVWVLQVGIAPTGSPGPSLTHAP